MSWKEDNLVDIYESKLQACINILLASDGSAGNRRGDGLSMQIATKELMEASHKLEQFFIQAQIAYHAKNANASDQEKIAKMQQEIERKDLVISEKIKKLEDWKKELSLLKQKQDELALTK